jgi:hypothetical protein
VVLIMPWINYPTFKAVPMAYGPVDMAFTDGSHVSVRSTEITYRGKGYTCNVGLYADREWQPNPAHYASVHRAGSIESAPPTYHAAIIDAIVTAVREYVAANPDVLRAAEFADANNEADHLDDEVARLSADLDKLRAEAATSRARAERNKP